MSTASFPKRLAYLKPVIAHLGAIALEELDENNPTAASLVEDALRQRIQGLSIRKAERVLDEDRKAIHRFLGEALRTETSPLHFIYYMYLDVPGIVDVLQNEEPELPPLKFKMAMETPEGFQLSESYSCILLKKGMLEGTIHGCDDVSLNPSLYEIADWDRPFLVDSDVRFGEVGGRKYLSVINHKGFFLKTVGYTLDVPGGWVHVQVQGKENFDESVLESRFHTIRILPLEMN
jgi:hypothetical protein